MKKDLLDFIGPIFFIILAIMAFIMTCAIVASFVGVAYFIWTSI